MNLGGGHADIEGVGLQVPSGGAVLSYVLNVASTARLLYMPHSEARLTIRRGNDPHITGLTSCIEHIHTYSDPTEQFGKLD